MAYLPLKSVPLPQASQRLFDSWLEELGARLAAPDADWHRITRDVLISQASTRAPVCASHP